MHIGPQRAGVRLLARCDNRCVFCAQRGDAFEAIDIGGEGFSKALEAARGAGTEVSFMGGEPLLHPGVEGAIAKARALGFVRIGLQSNARTLGEPGRVEGLKRAGLTDLQTSVLGATAAVHDYHTEVAGSFAQTMAGLAAARAAGLTVTVATVLTRSNFRVLADVPRLLSTRGVAAWGLFVPHVAGALGGVFDRVYPRLGLAMPFALHALEGARALRMPAFTVGAPLCLLGPLATRALDGVEAPRAFAQSPCGECGLRAECPGVDAAYLARFEGDELSLRGAQLAQKARAEAREPDEETKALARTFVGAGPLVAVERTREAQPAKARVGLPVLGRAQPAKAEAPSSKPKQSGEALREIFPELFRGRDDKEGKGEG